MKNIEIQLIRNATLKLKYGDKVILVDPVLGTKDSFMSFVEPDKNLNPTIDLPLLVGDIINDIDAVLITHSHPDHFDAKAIEVLDKNISVYTQAFDLENVRNAGFNKVIAVSDIEDLDGITITRTGGKHGPDNALDMLGEVSGFVLQKDDYPTIYIVGDCIWDAEIEGNIKKFNPGIVITNSGGAIFMGQSRILMDEKDTMKVAKYANNATVVAVHMEALDHCKTTREILKAEAEKEKVNILIPQDGENLIL